MRPPKLIKPYVISFARQVVGANNAAPFYVKCSPVQGAAYDECFPLIDDCVANCGGTSVIGWAIWERPKVYIEAEFHAVWRAPSGEHIDFSPRRLPVPRILFLPDPCRKYNGTQVNNIRKALINDKDVKNFLALADEWFRLTNEGKLKHQREVHVTPEMLRVKENRAALELKIVQRYGPLLPEGFSGAS